MITSKQNEKYKLWTKLLNKKYRDEYNLFLVFGNHLVDKANEVNAVYEIVTTNENIDGTLIDSKLMKELAPLETTPSIMAVCKKESKKIISNKILMLDDVQDPNNVGALLRSASAFGFNHVILGLKSADLYNEKVIRASQGAIFDVYVERRNLKDSILELKQAGYNIICADAHGNTNTKKNDKIVLVLGNEGQGINSEIKNMCDQVVTIQTQKVESLNVSVAGSILMYLWRSL